MLKTFLSIAFGSEEKPHIVLDASSSIDQRLAWLRPVMELFPIGRKQRYYPSHRDEIVFDTIVVAYRVNGHMIYSLNEIDSDAEGSPAFFKIGQAGERVHVSQLKNFELVVPDTSDMERTLDYERRAALGRGRQFDVGNVISLVSSQVGRGASVLDTVVRQVIESEEGPYAYRKLICLQPTVETMSVTDQRAKARAITNVPVLLAEVNGAWQQAWKIIDISDQAIRVQRCAEQDPEQEAELFPLHQEVLLQIRIPNTEQAYDLKGYVMRRFPKIRVIRLVAVLNQKRFQNFAAYELLELRAALLNYKA